MSDEERDRRDRRCRDATGPVVRAIRSIGLRAREGHRGDDLTTPPGTEVPTSIADRDTDRVEAADLPRTTPPELPAAPPILETERRRRRQQTTQPIDGPPTEEPPTTARQVDERPPRLLTGLRSARGTPSDAGVAADQPAGAPTDAWHLDRDALRCLPRPALLARITRCQTELGLPPLRSPAGLSDDGLRSLLLGLCLTAGRWRDTP